MAGGTSSGKTTLTDALLAEVAKISERVVLTEDTGELQCKATNLVALRAKDCVISSSVIQVVHHDQGGFPFAIATHAVGDSPKTVAYRGADGPADPLRERAARRWLTCS